VSVVVVARVRRSEERVWRWACAEVLDAVDAAVEKYVSARAGSGVVPQP